MASHITVTHRTTAPGGGIALLLWAACSVPSGAQPAGRAPLEPAVLQSSVLTLEVSPRPYRYRVIERATGRVLVSHAATRLRVGDAVPELRGVASFVKAPTSLEAKLSIGNTSNQATVRFAFVRPEVLEVVVSFDRGPTQNVTETFEDQGEHYYGIWENPLEAGALDNRGAEGELLGLRNMPDINYPSARAPFYLTSRGYGIYTQSDGRGHYRIAVKGKTTASFDDERLRYSILYGPSYAQILERYNELAGGASMPPLWAFDAIWWRDDHHRDWQENGVQSSQELVIKDADALRANRIHGSAIWLDRPYGSGRLGWGNLDFDQTFPDPARMVAELRARGMNLVLWTANRAANTLLQEGKAAGYTFSEDVYTTWPAVDVGQPKAYDWFKQKLDAYVRLGVKGYKIDRGEEAEMPDAVQNRMLTLFAKLSKEGLEAAYPGDNLVFARNVHDTGRRYSAVWNGDSETTWAGLVISVKNALRCGAINFPMWGSDVGGYHRGTLGKELFARWLQFGAYSSMMEVLIGGGRTPWIHYDPELLEITRAQAAAHHDLMPYVRSSVQLATRTGLPVMRQLLFDYPQDESLFETWDEYMFGPWLLVAPVTSDGARERKVYLPDGYWLDYNDRRTVHRGGATITAAAPLASLPLFVKEGAIIARGDILQANNNWTPRWTPSLRIEVFPGRQTTAFDYFTGSAVQPIRCSVGGGATTIELGDLGIPGVLEIHVKDPGSVRRDGKTLAKGKGFRFDSARGVLTIPFRGATKVTLAGAVSLFS